MSKKIAELLKDITNKELAEVLKVAVTTKEGQHVLGKAMDSIFEEGGWTIPDDAIVGIYAHKIDQLKEQVDSLTKLAANIAAKIEGKPTGPSGRVDAIAATKKK